MGVTIRQKTKGKGKPWWIFVSQNNRRWCKRLGDRRAAEAVASALRQKIKAGEFHIDEKARLNRTPEFSQYAQHYLESYAKSVCKYNTWYNYQIIIEKYLIPIWKGKHLDQITRGDVKQFLLQKQQEGLSPKTVENYKALISGLFTHAYEDEILVVNPALKLGRFIQKDDRRKEVRPLNREQVTKFLAKAQELYPRHYPILLCAFRTGLRLGELLGLAWDGIRFDNNTITVKRSYSHGRWSTPKSNKSRIVDMSDQLRTTLLAHRSRLTQRFKRGLPTTKVPNGHKGETEIQLVFPSREGGPTDGDNLRNRVFYDLLEKVDIPKIRFHDIRHTFASLLLQNGESLHYVKEQMGHASITTTVDIYGHLVPGSNRNAVNRLDDAPMELKVVPAEAG
ncbi:MAG: tyrosine-type recombinase/integrase [Phycisphaerae bacterium]